MTHDREAGKYITLQYFIAWNTCLSQPPSRRRVWNVHRIEEEQAKNATIALNIHKRVSRFNQRVPELVEPRAVQLTSVKSYSNNFREIPRSKMQYSQLFRNMDVGVHIVMVCGTPELCMPRGEDNGDLLARPGRSDSNGR